jgi:hypothetical protein
MIDRQMRLQSRNPRRRFREAGGRETQLVRFRPVLAIINDNQLTPGNGQSVTQGPGLGARRPVRGNHDPHSRTQQQRQRCVRFMVIGLEQEQDFQAVTRIIECIECCHKNRHHARLPVQRYKHAVEGGRPARLRRGRKPAVMACRAGHQSGDP